MPTYDKDDDTIPRDHPPESEGEVDVPPREIQ